MESTSRYRMKIIFEPLAIAARDLLRGVGYELCGLLYIPIVTLLWKKWKPRYVIISEGCLYIYHDKNSSRVEQAYSLNEFESASECCSEGKEAICFCLRYKKSCAPILFACDTVETRETWVKTFSFVIAEVDKAFSLSNDSGYGSAEAVPRNSVESLPNVYEGSRRYDEVAEWKLRQLFSPVQASDGQIGHNTQVQVQSDVMRNEFMGVVDELKMEVDKMHDNPSRRYTPFPPKNRSFAKATDCQSSSLAREPESVSSSIGPYMSVRGNGNVIIEEPQLTQSLYENNDIDNTSPKLLYDSPEEMESIEHPFEWENFFSCEREKAKSVLKEKPSGVFAVFPGESAELVLCVATPMGLKCFRIYSQNEQYSLYPSNQRAIFDSLGDLLSFYHDNNLPRSAYNVKLQHGFKYTSK